MQKRVLFFWPNFKYIEKNKFKTNSSILIFKVDIQLSLREDPIFILIVIENRQFLETFFFHGNLNEIIMKFPRYLFDFEGALLKDE